MRSEPNHIFLSHCSVSPIHPSGAQAVGAFNAAQAALGPLAFEGFGEQVARFRNSFARILNTSPDNIAFTPSTAAALNQVALGYPFGWRDRILTYAHEFPSNYHPWVLAAQRSRARLDVLPNTDPAGAPVSGSPQAWSFADVERLTTKRTRLIALSHVQYTSGFAADLERLGAFCRNRGIDLVIDAAQSLGVLPIEPERYGISAIAASGWKFLLGPHGSGVFYTSPEFRKKLAICGAGAMMMKQSIDYSDLSWNPVETAQRFEPTTPPAAPYAGLAAVAETVFCSQSIAQIRSRTFDLQTVFLNAIDRGKYQPLEFASENRSAICAFRCAKRTHDIVTSARNSGLLLTERGGYLRVAPHITNSEAEMLQAAEILNSVG